MNFNEWRAKIGFLFQGIAWAVLGWVLCCAWSIVVQGGAG